ncbi:hypothetical protein ACWCRF_11620 [Streptomyces sp. NPDC002405]
MSPRTLAARDRRTGIARIARDMKREHGHARPADVAAAASGAGLKASYPEVCCVLRRIGLHR